MELPELFIKQIKEIFTSEADAMLNAMDSDSSISVRVNTNKIHHVPLLEQVKWCNSGYYLPSRPQFTFDPLLHSGCYYVQDASSMFIDYAIRKLVSSPVRYLDLCAAPGGKTTTAINALPKGSLVVANEIMTNRAQILKENIIKWGNPSCVVTNNDSFAYAHLEGYFDVIAADVPCSGEGMMRKDPEAVNQWTPALVDQCAERQKEIVNNAWTALRPGGIFIYSTCTFNRAENEEMVEYMVNELGAESIDLCPSADWNIHTAVNSDAHCYRFLPHLIQGEGLFLAALRKPEDCGNSFEYPKTGGKKKGKQNAPAATVPAEVKNWIADKSNFTFTVNNDQIEAYPTEYARDFELLRNTLKVIYSGCRIATLKGRDFTPTQALAVNSALNTEAFESCPIDYQQAIAYLRGETIVLDAPRGTVLLTYNGAPLGFAKNLGNRANNLYPKEWRIRSTHTPQSEPKIIL